MQFKVDLTNLKYNKKIKKNDNEIVKNGIQCVLNSP